MLFYSNIYKIITEAHKGETELRKVVLDDEIRGENITGPGKCSTSMHVAKANSGTRRNYGRTV